MRRVSLEWSIELIISFDESGAVVTNGVRVQASGVQILPEGAREFVREANQQLFGNGAEGEGLLSDCK